jgi:hypothetical protein
MIAKRAIEKIERAVRRLKSNPNKWTKAEYIEALEDGLDFWGEEADRFEGLFATALRHIRNLETGITGPSAERQKLERWRGRGKFQRRR